MTVFLSLLDELVWELRHAPGDLGLGLPILLASTRACISSGKKRAVGDQDSLEEID